MPLLSNLSRLSPPEKLERLIQSLAMLEAILTEDWDSRFYSFYPEWTEGERMGWRRERSGAELFAHFSAAGCFIKGFDPQARLPEIDPGQFYGQVPEEFAAGAAEIAFTPENVTFCCWRRPAEAAWNSAVVPAYAGRPDGSESLLDALDGDPESYRRRLQAGFGSAPDAAPVARIYAQEPLTPELANALHSAQEWSALVREAKEIGYPVAGWATG